MTQEGKRSPGDQRWWVIIVYHPSLWRVLVLRRSPLREAIHELNRIHWQKISYWAPGIKEKKMRVSVSGSLSSKMLSLLLGVFPADTDLQNIFKKSRLKKPYRKEEGNQLPDLLYPSYFACWSSFSASWWWSRRWRSSSRGSDVANE